LSETGELKGSIEIVSQGTQYRSKFSLENMQPSDKESRYKSYWNNINNLNIKSTFFTNDKDKIIFTEKVQISAENYGSISGNKIFFVPNAYNQYTSNIKKSRNRQMPFEIKRGFIDNDEITITLPVGFAIEALPENVEWSNKFGLYKSELIKKDGLNLIYKRSLFMKRGLYPKEDFEEYRQFIEMVKRNDNSKMIIVKN
jgi:hypothetical protein